MNYAQKLESMNIPTRDDGLAAYCEFREQWELETNIGTEYVPCDVADMLPEFLDSLYLCDEANGTDFQCQLLQHVFGDYIEGSDIDSGERVSRWCAYWSMPGYMDKGIEHCADTESEALIMLLHYDGTGEPITEGVPEWEHDVLIRLAELADGGDTHAITYLEACFE